MFRQPQFQKPACQRQVEQAAAFPAHGAQGKHVVALTRPVGLLQVLCQGLLLRKGLVPAALVIHQMACAI